MRKQLGSSPSAAADAATKAYVDGRTNGSTNYYQALNPPQAFTWSSGTSFTLTNPASAVVSVELNGQALQPSEYALTSSTVLAVALESTTFVAGDKLVVTTVQVGSFTGTSTADLEITDPTRGLILRSPNGTRWRITVGNTGGLSTTAVS